MEYSIGSNATIYNLSKANLIYARFALLAAALIKAKLTLNSLCLFWLDINGCKMPPNGLLKS
jgi:hypothetical protein